MSEIGLALGQSVRWLIDHPKWAVVLILTVPGLLFLASLNAPPEFSEMTPEQHLAEAKNVAKPGATESDLKWATSNLEAIPPSSPDYPSAQSLKKTIEGQVAQENARKREEEFREHPPQDAATEACLEHLRAEVPKNYPGSLHAGKRRVVDNGNWNYTIDAYLDLGDNLTRFRYLYTCEVHCEVAVGECVVDNVSEVK